MSATQSPTRPDKAKAPDEVARELWSEFLRKIVAPFDLNAEECAAILGMSLGTIRNVLSGGTTRRNKCIALLRDALERNKKARWRSDLRLPDRRGSK